MKRVAWTLEIATVAILVAMIVWVFGLAPGILQAHFPEKGFLAGLILIGPGMLLAGLVVLLHLWLFKPRV